MLALAMVAEKGGAARHGLHVTSPLRSVRFTDVAGRDCALDRLPRLPGGFLTGTFGFRSEVRGKDGFTVPPIALAWHLEGLDGDRSAIGAGSTVQPCCSTGQLDVYDFDPHSGEGSIAFRIAVLAVDGHGPFLFPGANQLAMFFGHAETMTFALDAPATGWSHAFESLTLHAVNPPIALVIQASELQPDERSSVTLVLDAPAAAERCLRVGVDFLTPITLACGGAATNGLTMPAEVTIAAGERVATFEITFAPTRCGNLDTTARLWAMDEAGERHFANSLELQTRMLLDPGNLRQSPFEDDDNVVWWEINARCIPAAVLRGPFPPRYGQCERRQTAGTPPAPVLGLFVRTGTCVRGTTTCMRRDTRLTAPGVLATTRYVQCAWPNAAAVAGPQTMPGFRAVTTYTQTTTTVNVSNVSSCV